MPLPEAHPMYPSRDPEVQSLLDETVDALVRSRVSLRKSNGALIRADQEHAQHRKQLEDSRRTLSAPASALRPEDPTSWK